jgi:hypothetical protein
MIMETLIYNSSYKIVSEFRFWPKLSLVFLMLLLCFIDTFYFINIPTYFGFNKPFHFLSFPFVILNPIVLSLVFREINEKAYKITIDGDTITRIRNFGFGLKKVYKIDDFTGFFSYSIVSEKNAAEYLYLVIGDKKVIKLSTFYNKNYSELIASFIQHQIKNLGTERWGIWKHLNERTY